MAAQAESYTSFSGNTAIDNLLYGSKWATTSLSYGFPTSASNWSGYGGAGMEHPYQGFSTVNSSQVTAIKNALQGWANVANLNFTQVTEPGTIADLRFANSSVPRTAEAFFPTNEPYGGDTWFGPDFQGTTWTPGTDAYSTMPHEIGHALGLKHPHDAGGGGTLDAGSDSVEFSIMSYRSYVNAPVDGGESGYVIVEGSYPAGPMMNDIAAAQWLYGANFSYRSGDDTYSWTPGSTKVFETIWDGGGTDTYDLSAYSTGVTISLVPGQWSVLASSQLAELNRNDLSVLARGNVANAYQYNGDTRSLIENARGGAGGDTITGNDANNTLIALGGDDTLSGGGGVDMLYGNQGADLLYGNAGVDFLYGGQGNDVMYGGSESDVLYGNMFNDVMYGDAGNDTLYGGQGSDQMFGGAGDDVLYSDRADDTMNGGDGADRFFVKAADTVTDFDAAEGDRVAIATGTVWSVSDSGGSALINFGGGDTLLLSGVSAGAVNSGWFVNV